MKLREKMESLIDEMLAGQILLGEAVSEFEKVYIEKAIARYGSQVSRTAAALGIHRNTLARHLANGSDKTTKKTKPKRIKTSTAKTSPRKAKAAKSGR